MKASMIAGGCLLLLAAAAGLSQTTDLPEAPGKHEMLSACASRCHAVNLVVARRLPKDLWAAVIEVMIQKGADMSPEQQAVILDYLAEHFGQPGTPAEAPATEAK